MQLISLDKKFSQKLKQSFKKNKKFQIPNKVIGLMKWETEKEQFDLMIV